MVWAVKKRKECLGETLKKRWTCTFLQEGKVDDDDMKNSFDLKEEKERIYVNEGMVGLILSDEREKWISIDVMWNFFLIVEQT